jgi:tetratricopeptide (TPR) repeat protein
MSRVRLFFLLNCFSAWAADELSVYERIQSARAAIARHEFVGAVHQLLPTLAIARRAGATSETEGEILNDLGYAYRMDGQCGNAIQALTAAAPLLGSTPKAQMSRVYLIGSYLDCGQTLQAAAIWARSSVPLRPSDDSASLWAAGGTVEAARGHYAKSEALFDKAITFWERDSGKASERSVLARISRAVDRAYLHRFDEATADIADVPVLSGVAPCVRAMALSNVAVVQFLASNLEGARTKFEEAIAAAGPEPTCSSIPVILANYGALLRKMGDKATARSVELRARQAADFLAARSGQTVDARVLGSTR